MTKPQTTSELVESLVRSAGIIGAMRRLAEYAVQNGEQYSDELQAGHEVNAILDTLDAEAEAEAEAE